jgi:hypothetical protein
LYRQNYRLHCAGLLSRQFSNKRTVTVKLARLSLSPEPLLYKEDTILDRKERTKVGHLLDEKNR